MSITRRNALLAAGALLATGHSFSAWAADYPDHPVKIIVPFGAGGPADVFSRQIAQFLQDQLKQSFVVEDRPGAGSIIGTDAVAKSLPDGYTLLAMSNTHTVNESLVPQKPCIALLVLTTGFGKNGALNGWKPDTGVIVS